MERAAPQELSQKRSRRQIIIRYTLEVFQKLKQPVSLSIFLTILRNLLQQRLCLHLDYSQFIKHRRIEHRIGILLEREYPLVLTCPYRRPAMNGFYVDIRLGRPVVDEDVNIIRRRMQEIIDARMPIRRFTVPTEEAVALFQEKGDIEKVKLLKTSGSIYTTYYKIGDYVDYYYGTLLTNTSQLYLFGLEKYYDGMLLRIPSLKNPDVLGEMTRQDKMFEIFKEHHRWQSILGIRTIGDFNQVIDANHATDIINISEALQEKKIAKIAEEIASRKGVKLVLLAGPSSSGKTTSCKRLSIQLAVNGLKPLQISLDDYFVDREKTPKDASGEYDYESIYALDLDLINEQFNALFRGEEVELPKYDFQSGKSKKSGNKLKMNDNNVLVVEGIHALNPELTAHIPQEQIFRVYASALTTMS